ncbi:MAG: family 20 glycosylhydrolase [Acidobacteria bacterium]|nr:family 20 glycosylhydrolase [Acidobacteriota bacterium]
MKHLLLAIAISLFFASIQFAQSDEINIIPKPVSIEPLEGSFKLNHRTKIFTPDKAGRKSAQILNDLLHTRYGFKLEYTSKLPKENYIQFSTLEGGVINWKQGIHPGAYRIEIDPSSIRIMGVRVGEIGKFYAIQTLMQLLPARFDGEADIAAMRIVDYPRFKYRGMHLDVSRHFMPVEFVKKYIDLMSQYKLNYFHWHLTDDQGWRIEIKKYPKLTTVGQYRSESHEGSYSTTFKGDGRPVQGFYTQEQIKDVVRYAKERHITVVPEIELPGHASAALAAYPELGKGCAVPDYKFEVKKTWGIFKEVFCPTDATFKFLEDVLDETIKLFPDSPYIHIGGDEVLKDFWKESEYVQELKKRENLKDEHEVQSYFVRRMEKFVNSKGKKIIGWDEILEGGIAPNATIMSWRGMRGGIEAAKQKHDVIMTPTDYVYFDYGQGDPAYEPLNIGGYVPLSRVYSFNPVPPELSAEEAKYVIGGQANIWTEYLETPAAVEYMAFPRMLALAEVVWSKQEDRDFEDFQRRLAAQLPRLDKQNVNYRIPEPIGLKNTVIPDGQAISIGGIRSEIPGAKVHFTVDGSTPNENSPLIPSRFVANPGDGETLTLKTIVVLPNGRKSSVYAATFVRGKMREPDTTDANTAGLKYDLVVPDDEEKSTKGETRSILLTQFEKTIDLTKRFSVQFDGYLRIPTDGVYELQVDSTWDTTVVLDGRMIIDDAGTKDRKVKSALVPFKAGLHKISIRYGHRGGEVVPHFRFRYGIKGQGLRQAYGGEFVH